MKIICIGRNYREHAEELGNEIPEKPVIFMKPDTALLKGRDFYIPEFSQDIHYELEVVLKISRNGKYIHKENASQYYHEIGLGIDFTARDLQSELVGVVIGTYSSIYIASALALDFKLTARDLMPVQREKDAVDEMP